MLPTKQNDAAKQEPCRRARATVDLKQKKPWTSRNKKQPTIQLEQSTKTDSVKNIIKDDVVISATRAGENRKAIEKERKEECSPLEFIDAENY